VRGAAVTIEAIAIESHWPGNDVLYRVSVTTDAVFLNHFQGGLAGTDGIGKVAKGKGRDMPKTRLGFDEVFRDKSVRGMTIAANCPAAMAAVNPVFVHRIHYVTVVAGNRVVPQISSEIADVQPCPDDCQKRKDANDERKFHSLASEFMWLLSYPILPKRVCVFCHKDYLFRKVSGR
jgi:hypothetical protein